MAYLDDLDQPALRPQLFNVAPPGTMRAQPRDPNAPDAMQSLVDAFHQYIIGAPGSGRVPAPVQGTAGGPDRITGIDPKQVPTAPAIPVNGPTAPDAVAAPAAKPPVARKAGGMPKATADTGVDANGDPKEGYYLLNGQAVPYGLAGLNMAGNGSSGYGAGSPYAVAASGGTGGGAGGGAAGGAGGVAGGGGSSYVGGGMVASGGLIDPRSSMQDVTTQQIHYARRAAQEILDQAGAPGELGYSARLHALSSVYLNGLAGVGQGGANSYNADLASMSNEGSRAAASRYASDRGLTGTMAHVGAQDYATRTQADTAADQHAIERDRLATDMVPGGSELVRDPGTGLMVPVPSYMPRSKVSGMPAPYEARQSAKPAEGATGKTPNGAAVVFKNGQWVPAK